MSQLDIQKKLLDQLLDRFPKRSVAVEELSRLLQVGSDGIYRRLRGDTALSPAELALLAQTYNLSVDALIFEETDQVIFSYSQFSRPVHKVIDYIDEVHNRAEQLVALPEVHVSYTAQDIPVFLYYASPVLFRFKMYIYGSNYWHLPAFEGRPFSLDLVSEAAFLRGRQVATLYNSIPSLEVWRLSLIDSTLNQIQFLLSSGTFARPPDCLLILDALQELMSHARQMAEHGLKATLGVDEPASRGVFQLFYNDFVATNDTILIETMLGDMLITSFGMPNFLETRNLHLLAQIKDWFQVITAKSTSLSRHGAKSRNWYFNQLFAKIQNARERLELMLEDI